MAVTWIKTNFLGVRYREHATRKHGVRPDRCFSIRYKVDGKDREEVAGWASEEMSAEKAFKMLSAIRDNIKKGTGPKSLAGIREENERQAAAVEKEQRAKARDEVTFSEFWEKDYRQMAEATRTPRTMETERGYYKKWIEPILGDIPLWRIDAAKVEAVTLRAHKAGKSAGTICKIIGVVSQVWNRAASRDVVQGECPVRKVKKPRQDNRRVRFLSQDEAKTVLNALILRSVDVHDEALLSLLCGLRAGEIHNLTWGDVDLKNGTIHIRDPKNKRNRHAFITEEVKTMLERRHQGQATTELVFPTYNGKPRLWVSDTFSRTIDELGLNNTGEFTADGEGNPVPIRISDARQRVVFHTLRHTFASWLVQQGTPLYTVAELMGHTTIEMSRRYSHLAPDTLRKAALSLQGKLGG
ncbi:MAG: site-specific integrase [Desulfovibrio sp.]|jgi:integrase|nr:site-specific integrase [Desulfovibrio sp.]